MSIAVSAVVYPSRVLLVMVGAMSVTVVAIGIAVAMGLVGELSTTPRLFLGALVVFLAVFGFYHGARLRKPIHIDISGAGQLRLTDVSAAGPCIDTNWPHVRTNGEVVRLLKNSMIWPHLLLLRLQSESGKMTILMVLPDSVSRDNYRALSVACRWIAAHSNPAEGKIFRNCFK
jgi:toxin CptA